MATKRTKSDEVSDLKDLVKDLIRTNADLQKSQTELVTRVVEMAAGQNEIMSAWLALWKPPQRPEGNRTDTLNERLTRKEGEVASDWEPIAEDVLAKLKRDLNVSDDDFTSPDDLVGY